MTYAFKGGHCLVLLCYATQVGCVPIYEAYHLCVYVWVGGEGGGGQV